MAVPLRQVVVDGYDMDALAVQGVEVGRRHRGKGFAFAGLHLDDFALMKHYSAHDLDVEGPFAQNPPGGLPGQGEGLGHYIVQRLAPGQAFGQSLCLERKFGIGKGQSPGFLLIDSVH